MCSGRLQYIVPNEKRGDPFVSRYTWALGSSTSHLQKSLGGVLVSWTFRYCRHYHIAKAGLPALLLGTAAALRIETVASLSLRKSPSIQGVSQGFC